MNNSTAFALILAGGKSSRMGRDKALILWEDIPILDRVCQAAATCCQEIYIFTPWPERYKSVLSNKYNFLKERNPGNGPLVAFAEGLTQITSHVDWVLLLACDLPKLDREVLQTWATQLDIIPTETMAIVPYQNESWEPLCGFYRLRVRPSLEKFIQEGGRSFQSWLSQISVRAIPVGEKEARMLWNCNTPEDLPNFVI
jgi:molybdenum cofactor guanylyltransferase